MADVILLWILSLAALYTIYRRPRHSKLSNLDLVFLSLCCFPSKKRETNVSQLTDQGISSPKTKKMCKIMRFKSQTLILSYCCAVVLWNMLMCTKLTLPRLYGYTGYFVYLKEMYVCGEKGYYVILLAEFKSKAVHW